MVTLGIIMLYFNTSHVLKVTLMNIMTIEINFKDHLLYNN